MTSCRDAGSAAVVRMSSAGRTVRMAMLRSTPGATQNIVPKSALPLMPGSTVAPAASRAPTTFSV